MYTMPRWSMIIKYRLVKPIKSLKLNYVLLFENNEYIQMYIRNRTKLGKELFIYKYTKNFYLQRRMLQFIYGGPSSPVYIYLSWPAPHSCSTNVCLDLYTKQQYN